MVTQSAPILITKSLSIPSPHSSRRRRCPAPVFLRSSYKIRAYSSPRNFRRRRCPVPVFRRSSCKIQLRPLRHSFHRKGCQAGAALHSWNRNATVSLQLHADTDYHSVVPLPAYDASLPAITLPVFVDLPDTDPTRFDLAAFPVDATSPAAATSHSGLQLLLCFYYPFSSS